MSFESEYRDLLIKQYWQQPNATAEIELKAGTWARVFEWLNSFPDAFDLDLATGDRLDIIGRIVGLDRIEGFDSDEDYRFLLRVKIIKNTASAVVIGDPGSDLQSAIQFAFGGNAYVVDNQDMSLTVTATDDLDLDLLILVFTIQLVPKPQGVRYILITETVDLPFGFSEKPNVLTVNGQSLIVNGEELELALIENEFGGIDGFAELGEDPLEGGELSELITIEA